jgi:DNA repair photolyase
MTKFRIPDFEFPPTHPLTIQQDDLLIRSIEHRASSIEHRASSIEHRASSIEHRASSIEARGSIGSAV